MPFARQCLTPSLPLTRYCYSLYWAVVTMATVGYGDITPTNWVEMIVAMVIIIIGE